LDPTVYPVPDAEEPREHFATRLADQDPQSAEFVAVVDGAVVDMGPVENAT